MRLFWGWKIKLSSSLLLLSLFGRAQESATPIEDFKNKKVLYVDVGYRSAPFNIDCPVGGETVTLKYKNNFRTLLGIGFAYKWFHLRIGFPVLNYVKSVEKWGESNQFNLGLNFTIKKFFFDFDFSTVQGYAIQNYGSIDSTYIESIDQLRVPGIGTTNFSLNSWYFHDHDFKMSALRGIQAHYKEPVHTWYIKATMNVFGVDNNGSSIVPYAILDPDNDKTQASTLSAFDFGLIPGYAYVNRVKNWQFSGWLGLGAVIQSKFYFSDQNRGFLGLAPRYDIRLLGGYSNKKFFTFVVLEFDNKSIRFSDLKYNLNSHSIKIIGGIRFGK
jgi:hypothetical protein